MSAKNRNAENESELKSKLLWLTDVHEERIVEAYNDPENCPYPEMAEQIRSAIQLMREITAKIKLKKIKTILNPQQYNLFLSAYDEFKRTGKFTVVNPNTRD